MNIHILFGILFRIFLSCDCQSHSQRSIDLNNPIDIEVRTSPSSFLFKRTKLNKEEARLPYIVNRDEGIKSGNVPETSKDSSFSRRRLSVEDSFKPISQINPERSALQRRRESELQINEALRKRDQKLFSSFDRDNRNPYPPLNIGDNRDRFYNDHSYHSSRRNYQFASNSNQRPKLKPPILIIEKIPVLVTEKPSIYEKPTYNHNLDRRPDRYPPTVNHFNTQPNNRKPVNSFQNDHLNHNYYDTSKGSSNLDNTNPNYGHTNYNHYPDDNVNEPPNFGSSDFYNKPYSNQYANQYTYEDSSPNFGPFNNGDYMINGQYPNDNFHLVGSSIPNQNTFDVPEPSFYPEEDHYFSSSFGPVPGELVEGHPIPHVIEEEYEDDLHTQRKLQAALAAQALAIGAIRQQAFARFALNQRLGQIAAARNLDTDLPEERDLKYSTDLHQPSASSNVDLSVYDDKIHKEQLENLSQAAVKSQMKTYIRRIMTSDKAMNENDRRNFMKNIYELRRGANKKDIDTVKLSSTASDKKNSSTPDILFLQFLLRTPNSFFEDEFDISKEDFIEKIVPKIFRTEQIDQLSSSSWIPNTFKNIETKNFNTPIDVETIGTDSKSIRHQSVPKFLTSFDNQIKDSEFTVPTDARTGGFKPSLPISLTKLEDVPLKKDDKLNDNVHILKSFDSVFKDENRSENNGVTPKIFYDKISHPKATSSKTNFNAKPTLRKSSTPTKEMIQDSVPERIYFDDLHVISSSNDRDDTVPRKQEESSSDEDVKSNILPIYPGIDDDTDHSPIRLFEKRKGSDEKPQTVQRQRYQEKPAVVTFAAPTSGPTLLNSSGYNKFTPLPVIDNKNEIDKHFKLTERNSYSNSGFGKKIRNNIPQRRNINSDQFSKQSKRNTITQDSDNGSTISNTPESRNPIANQLPAHYRITPECAGGLIKQRSFCLFSENYPREAALKISSNNEELIVNLLEVVKKVENPKIDLKEAARQIPGLNGSKSCEEETKEVDLGWFENVLGNWLVILQPFRQNNLSQPLTVNTCSIKSRNEGCKPLLLPRAMVAFHPEDEDGKPFISQFAVPVTCVHAQ